MAVTTVGSPTYYSVVKIDGMPIMTECTLQGVQVGNNSDMFVQITGKLQAYSDTWNGSTITEGVEYSQYTIIVNLMYVRELVP